MNWLEFIQENSYSYFVLETFKFHKPDSVVTRINEPCFEMLLPVAGWILSGGWIFSQYMGSVPIQYH